MLKSLLASMSPSGARARLSVLILHRVFATPDPVYPEAFDAAAFDRLCGWLAQLFNVLPLDEAVQRLDAGTLPARALSITFDDGYACGHDVALPVLRRHGLSATFFVTTGTLDGGCMWNDVVAEAVRRTPHAELDLRGLGVAGLHVCPLDGAALRREAIEHIQRRLKYLPLERRLALVEQVAERAGVLPPDHLMLSSGQVRALRRAGMGIGAHTVSHPILTGLDADQVRFEIGHSRRQLESILGEPVELFAYPNGKWSVDFDRQSVEIVRELGFKAAFTTEWGGAGRGTDRLLIPRFTPWDRTRLRFGLRMAANLLRRAEPSALPPRQARSAAAE